MEETKKGQFTGRLAVAVRVTLGNGLRVQREAPLLYRLFA